MNELRLHIARDGIELGELLASDACELLAAGFLRPSDEYWNEGDSTRRRLSELPPPVSDAETSLIARVKSSATAIGETVRAQAANAAETLSGLARRNTAAVREASERMLEDYLPALRQQIVQRIELPVQTTKSALQDEAFVRKLFGAVYDCLPKPVYRFVGEAAFIEFCLKHRRKLLDP